MKDRFNSSNLPFDFLNDFHDIEVDDVRKDFLYVVNLMYDDYTVEEVQEMFSDFPSCASEVYYLYMNCRCEDDLQEYKVALDIMIEVIIYCASQLKSYTVRPIKRSYKATAKVAPRR